MADDNDNLESADEADEQETALLPRSWFQGKEIEVGKKCELKVEGIFDDEIEVSYVSHKKKHKDGKDKDSDDDNDKPKRHRRDHDDSDSMRESMREFDAIVPVPAPAPGGYY